jgi:hypothetical protein
MLGIVVAAYKEFSSRIKLMTTSGLTKGNRIGEIIKGTTGMITKSEIMENVLISVRLRYREHLLIFRMTAA